MSRISLSAVSWAWLLPRRGRSGRRLDFYGKHHATSSKMSAAWWQPYQVESASKTNFYIPQILSITKFLFEALAMFSSVTKLRTSPRFLHGLSY